MTIKEALSILNGHNYTVKKSLNESTELRFDTADQFQNYTQSLINKGMMQQTVKIGNINTVLSEKDLHSTGKDIGEVVIKRYCKEFKASKKSLQEAWDKGWEREDPDGFTEDDFKKEKDNAPECVEIFRKAAIMHAFLNNF